jgi:rsbT co-antagonist protein RsbR
MNPDHSLHAGYAEEARKIIENCEIEESDLELVRGMGKILIPKLPKFVTLFYEWLEKQPDYAIHFGAQEERLQRVQKLQIDYWREFFRGKIDAAYVGNRLTVGEVHARIGLPLPVYFAAVDQSFSIFSGPLLKGTEYENNGAALQAITKLLLFDTGLVVDRYSTLTNQKISQQTQALIEMSTPVTAIWEGILLLPIVGIIDSRRAQNIMNSMLIKIAETHSTMFILDISGVGVVDTAVANHLIKITKSTKLMGCECILSGISPAIAQTIVELGIDVGDMKTTSTLRDALESAFRKAGLKVG